MLVSCLGKLPLVFSFNQPHLLPVVACTPLQCLGNNCGLMLIFQVGVVMLTLFSWENEGPWVIVAAVVIFRPARHSNPPGQVRVAFQTGGGTFLWIVVASSEVLRIRYSVMQRPRELCPGHTGSQEAAALSYRLTPQL